MYIHDFFEQCKVEFRMHFRESMGFSISHLTCKRNDCLYTTLRATSIDWYTPIVDLMMRDDGKCMLVVSGYNEDDAFVELGIYELETRDIERFQIVLKYIMVAAVLRFHAGNKVSRNWGVAAATITDETHE